MACAAGLPQGVGKAEVDERQNGQPARLCVAADQDDCGLEIGRTVLEQYIGLVEVGPDHLWEICGKPQSTLICFDGRNLA